MHIEVRNLPDSLKGALRSLRYFRKDITVEARETLSPVVGGGKGSRGFFCLVNLATGEHQTTLGSWGGANMFNPQNRVDLDREEYPMQPGMAAIKGMQSHNAHYAYIVVHPENLAKLLPKPEGDDLTARQKKIVLIYRSIRGGCRDDYLRAGRPQKWELEQLEEMGYLKINRAGAVSTTTKAANADLGDRMGYWNWSDEEKRIPEQTFERAERSFAVEGARVNTSDGLAIYFAGPPPLYVRNELKANGFRWNGECWRPTLEAYKKMEKTALVAFAEKFVPKEMAA